MARISHTTPRVRNDALRSRLLSLTVRLDSVQILFSHGAGGTNQTRRPTLGLMGFPG
jgi:hypothetical protein